MMKIICKNKKIIMMIISAVLILAVAGYVMLNDNRGTDMSNKNTLETFDDSEKKEWSFQILDLTDKLSEDELIQIQTESQALLDSYNGIMFNLAPDTPDYSAELLSFCVPPEVPGSNRSENAQQFLKFREMGVESVYSKFEPYSITVNDGTEVPTVVINGLLSVNYKSNNIAQEDYDVCTKYIIEKRNDIWVVYNSQFSTIYKAGTVKAYSSDNNNTITYSGIQVGSFE